MRLLPAKHVLGNLARQDPMAPVREAAGTAKGFAAMISGGNDFAEAYLEAEDATNVAQMSAEYKKRTSILQSRLEGSPTIDFNNPLISDEMREQVSPAVDDYGVDISDPPAYLETHEVMQEIYDRETQKYEDVALSKIQTRKGRDDFYKLISNQRATSAAKVVSKSLEWRRASMSVVADMSVQTALTLPDPVEASQTLKSVADTAFKQGVWDYEKYFKTVTEGQQEIEFNTYDKNVRSAGTQEALDDIRTTLHNVPLLMTNQQKHKLLDDIDSREKSIDTALHKGNDARKQKSSGNARVSALYEMTRRGGPLTPSELRAALFGATETSDATSIMALQRVYQKEAKEAGTTVKSNPMSMLASQAIIQQLRFQSDEPMAERRAEAMVKIHELAGIDPDSGEINSSGTISITAKDLGYLTDQVEKVQGQIFKGPEMDGTIDTIYGLLTKGGKTTRNRPGSDEDRFSYQMAVEAETDLMNAASQAGPEFSPRNWWAENKGRYLTDAMKDNIAQIGEQFGRGVIKFKDGSQKDADIDLPATLKAARKKFPNFERRVNQIMDWATMAVRQSDEAAEAKRLRDERRKARQ